MRPEIDKEIIERLRKWAREKTWHRELGDFGHFGHRGKTYYGVQEALDDLLKEAGY